MPSSGPTTPGRRGILTRARRWAVTLCTLAVAAGLLTGPQATPAEASPRRDGSTGWILDVSPYQVGTVVSTSGHTTVLVRGTDNRIWYRTGKGSASWTPWTAIPGAFATSGPAAVIRNLAANGDEVEVVIRGLRNEILHNTTTLDPTTGQPTFWGQRSHAGLGNGVLTTAPAIAGVDDGRMAVAVRGTDGAIWYSVFDWWGTPGQWSPWTSLGGYATSAPAIEADFNGSEWSYIVTVVGTDGHTWRRAASAEHATPGAIGGWTPGVESSIGPGTVNVDGRLWETPRLISIGDFRRQPQLLDPDTRWVTILGGVATSPMALAGNPDGSVMTFVRGTDGGLWADDFGPQSWFPLGGFVA